MKKLNKSIVITKEQVREIMKKVDEKSKLNKKRGSELAQTVLITAIMVVIISTLFFPQIKGIFETSMTKMSEWFNGVLTSVSAG